MTGIHPFINKYSFYFMSSSRRRLQNMTTLPSVCCRSLCEEPSSELPAPSSHSGECASGTWSSGTGDGGSRKTSCGTDEKKQTKKQRVFPSEVMSERQSTADVERRQMKTHTGPLMIKDIITFMSAMYSFRSGYGRSTSALL